VKLRRRLTATVLLASLTYLALAVVANLRDQPDVKALLADKNTWQAAASPGPLSKAHAFLENNCNACHTPVAGVTASNCIVCHANNDSILQRQPTAFHADISSCSECHIEHRGLSQRPSGMDHNALTDIGLRQLDNNTDPDSEDRAALRQLKHFLREDSSPSPLINPDLTAKEKTLNCATCHKNDDRHFELFGSDCASCHSASAWTIPQYRHPSPASMDCAQCHQAPPSHYMKHFGMISQKVAGKPKAKVEQCYECHQTTSWPDILDAGWYKHH
jgi:Outer membrane cytochrome MtrC/MtrF-like, domains II/IV